MFNSYLLRSHPEISRKSTFASLKTVTVTVPILSNFPLIESNFEVIQ